MVNQDGSALRLLENGPFAPKCPDGHGPLTTVTDQAAPTGTALACPVCGRSGAQTDMLRTLLNPHSADFNQPLAVTADGPAPQPKPKPASAEETVITANPALEVTAEIPRVHDEEPAREPLGKSSPETTRDDLIFIDESDDAFLAEAARHRGSRPDGTIRTTGWLQLGRLPVSSGLWAALTGLAVGLALVDVYVWLPLILTVAACATWFVINRWLRPASVAVNRERIRASELMPGDALRLYGPIGPVGIVEEVSYAGNRQVHIRCAGGSQHFRAEDAVCHLVDLRN